VTTLRQIQTIKLTELTQKITGVINVNFQGTSYWVIADVSNHTFQPGYSRHFLELVEKNEITKAVVAKVAAIAWSTGAHRIQEFEKTTGQRFTNGIKVCLRVQVSFHAVYGLKLEIVDIDASFTIGQLELHRQETIRRLLTECSSFIQRVGDAFKTSNNGLSHATVIQKIAVLTSSSSAGLTDFMDVLHKNKYRYHFTINQYYTSVQGEANADAAVAKLNEICNAKLKFDAVVIIRGGGADTDFLMFDQFSLCSAVAKLHIPVITGIGHHKNQSLVDLMAHTAANTPTKAAEFIIAHNLAFETILLNEQKRMVIRAQQIVARNKQTVQALHATIINRSTALLTKRRMEQERLRQQLTTSAQTIINRQKLMLGEVANKAMNKPTYSLSNRKCELENETEKLTTAIRNFYLHQQRSIDGYETIFRLMSPVNLLKRGLAIVYHRGQIITGGSHLQAGDELTVRLQDATITSTITEKRDNNGNSEFDL
jgi:exodeoxyribonuclease VII large subunit